MADEVTRTHQELAAARRAAKQEESELIAAARADADEMRSSARRMLNDARAELERLTQRRDAIAGELGNLSGVIEALAVSGPESHRADHDTNGAEPIGTSGSAPAAPAEANESTGDAPQPVIG
jgi:chromosome segregation ATPase